MNKINEEEIFARLGFNALEAEVYVGLLKHGPQTAYKIGRLLNRPTANVYKAVDALLQHGAIAIEEGDVRVCSAIPFKSLSQQLQKAYQKKLDEAEKQLGRVKTEFVEEGIYKLQTVESALQKATEMLRRCRRIAVVDAFPQCLEKLKPELNHLAEAGVEVMVEAYEPVKLHKKISVVLPQAGADSLQHWQAEQLNIAVDGREIITCLFHKNLQQLVQATYSNNLYLACIMHNGLLSEQRVQHFLKAGNMKDLRKLQKQQRYLFHADVPGPKQLFELYRK